MIKLNIRFLYMTKLFIKIYMIFIEFRKQIETQA